MSYEICVQATLEEIAALVYLVVRERTHPECPPDKRFVSRISEVPGEWATREEATAAVIRYAQQALGMGEK